MLNWCEKGGLRGYVVTSPLIWEIGKNKSGWVFTVPVGKEFESSVPKCLQWLWSPDDPYYLKAAAIHDTLLENGYRPQLADSQWVEAAMSVGAPRIKTGVAYVFMVLRRLLKSGQQRHVA
jgi:hypothetical protein